MGGRGIIFISYFPGECIAEDGIADLYGGCKYIQGWDPGALVHAGLISYNNKPNRDRKNGGNKYFCRSIRYL